MGLFGQSEDKETIDPDCPKCGCSITHKKYDPGVGREYLRLKCHACEYSWREATLDQRRSDDA